MKRTRIAYVIVVAFSLVLLTAWYVGPPREAWASIQNRAPYEMPSVRLVDLAQTETFSAIDDAIGDSLRVRYPIVKFVNSSFLKLTSLSLNESTTTGTLVPQFFAPDALHTPLYLSEDFTLPCSRRIDLIVSGLDTFSLNLARSGRDWLILIAPNKTTVADTDPTPWMDALMQCSRDGRADLESLRSRYPQLELVSPQDVREALPNEPYWNGDTHWKPEAAASALPAIERFAGTSAADFDTSETLRTFSKTQDLLALLSIASVQTSEQTALSGKEIVYSNVTLNGGAVVARFENPNATEGMKTAVVVIDSFVTASDLQTKLLRNFAGGYVIDWFNIGHLAELPATDAVVLETVERYSYSRLTSLAKIRY